MLISEIDVKKLFEHKCYFLLYQQSKNKNPILNKTLLINKARVNEQYKACVSLLKDLNISGIPYAIYKGAPLSINAYGDVGFRASGDIDIITDRKHIKIMNDCLTSNGFTQGKVVDGKIISMTRDEKIFHLANTHQTVPYVKAIESKMVPFINIDINLSIAWGGYEGNINIEEFIGIPSQLSIYENLNIPVLSLDKHLLAICLHNYKDMNSTYLLYSRNGFPLSLLSDIYYYIKNSSVSLSEVYELSQIYKVSKYIYFCLFHAEKLFGDNTNEISIFNNDDYKDELWKYGLEKRFDWNYDWLDLLLNNSITEYLNKQLPDSEINKIKINLQYMQ